MSGIREDVSVGGMGGGYYGGGGYGMGWGGGWGGIAPIGLFGIFGGFGRDGFGRDGHCGGFPNGFAFNERGRELEMAFDGTNRNIDSLRGTVERDHTDSIIARVGDKIQAYLGNIETRNEFRFNEMQECCCEIKGAIKDNAYQAALLAKDNMHILDKGFCNVVQAINCDGDKTRALISALDREELRDKLGAATLENSQLKQNGFIAGLIDHKFKKVDEGFQSINANFGTITKTNTNTGVQA